MVDDVHLDPHPGHNHADTDEQTNINQNKAAKHAPRYAPSSSSTLESKTLWCFALGLASSKAPTHDILAAGRTSSESENTKSF